MAARIDTPLLSSHVRLWRAFLAARATLGLALVLTQLSAAVLNESRSEESLTLCLFYFGLTLVHALLPRLRRTAHPASLARLSSPRWWASMGVDLAMFSALQALEGGSGLPVAALYILPVLMAGVLSSRRTALATAAMATLGLLGGLLWAGLAGSDLGPRITQAGLAGSGYFVVALLAVELAGRLAREELAARGSQALARQQTALNQLVIDEMQEGVLVVDRELRVAAANPAACALLGEREPVPGAPFALDREPAWRGLAALVRSTLEGQPGQVQDVVLGFARAPSRTLRVRNRLSPGAEGEGALCLLLLEDRATLLARARRDKLAAMGRMSAGIAHEIRNPLAAIAQANALLAEDLGDPADQRLTGLVASNVKRLQRIVDEVMLLAAPPDSEPLPLDARALVQEVAEDWARTQGLQIGAALRLQLPDAALVLLFESEHLRRVLVNLLDNAWRHARCDSGPPWVALSLEALDDEQALVTVFNPGPPIPPEVERHLFEPFYSTRSRGAGLGLSICRELCERYRARIEYRADRLADCDGAAFRIHLQRATQNPTP